MFMLSNLPAGKAGMSLLKILRRMPTCRQACKQHRHLLRMNSSATSRRSMTEKHKLT